MAAALEQITPPATSDVDVVKEQPRKKRKTGDKRNGAAAMAPSTAEPAGGSAAGMVDVFQKLLGKPMQATEEPILAKDKRHERRLQEEEERAKAQRETAAGKKLVRELGRVKPDLSTRNHERALAKIATSGVVKLFNAVRKQQKQLAEKVESETLMSRKEKVAKNALSKQSFLAMLKGPTTNEMPESNGTANEKPVATNAKQKWLSSSYMIGAKMKDWDKKEESSQSDVGEADSEPDSPVESDG